MASLFKGVAQAKNYAAYRPTYPSSVYERILSTLECPSTLAVDVGCGTGQATVVLADSFQKVIGIDPSPTQLESATSHPNVTYRLGTVEEQLGEFEDSSVSCVTSAQAAHWFEIPKFYDQVDRVLSPGGVVALWTYGLNHFPDHPHVEETVMNFYHNVLGPEYWDSRRKLVEDRYDDIPLINELPVGEKTFQAGERVMEGLEIKQTVSSEELVGYLRSWSGYAQYCKDNQVEKGTPEDPVQSIQDEIDGVSDILMVFPVTMLIAVKKGGNH